MTCQVHASRRDGSKRTFEADTQLDVWEQAAGWIRSESDMPADETEQALMALARALARTVRVREL